MIDHSRRAIGTLTDILAVGAGGKAALVFPDVTFSFADLRGASSGWGALLAARGVTKGDYVGVLLPTCPEFVQLVFGIAALGAVVVPVNPRYRARELRHVITDSRMVALVTTNAIAEHVDFVARIAEAMPDAHLGPDGQFACGTAPALRNILVIGGDERPGTIAVDGTVPALATAVNVEADDLALVLYTSGTTSNPKGCMITHGVLAASAQNYAAHYGCTTSDSFWCPLPIHHVAGIVPLLAILSVGGTFSTLRRFDAGDALDLIASQRPTCGLPSYTTIAQDLLDHPKFKSTDFGSFRWMNISPSVQPRAQREEWACAMPHVRQIGTYGMTEGVGPVTGHRLDDPAEWCARGLGRPLAGWEVRVADTEESREVPDGLRGEILLRGPGLARGYHNRTEAIADTEGWFHTGDLGKFEDGQLVFCGRLKDMLKVGGENVAAAEIEAILDTHPAVRMSQVIGIADARYTEVPVAFVQLMEGSPAVTPAELIDLCRKQLAAFKVPRDIVFIEEWPMSTTKIQKFRLRERYEAQPAQSSAHHPRSR